MIILRQKQFNIAQEFYHSGGSRVMKKYAGRLQRKIGKKLEDLSVKQVSNNSEVLKLAKDLEKESISNKKLGKALSRGKRAVINQKGSQAVFAHEIAHVMNQSKLGTGVVSKLNGVTKPIYHKSRNKNGLGNYLLTSATGKVLIKEEKNATKTAMKLLRSANANPSEMIEARKELGADLGTYMHGYKSSKGKILKGIIKPNRIKKKNKKRP